MARKQRVLLKDASTTTKLKHKFKKWQAQRAEMKKARNQTIRKSGSSLEEIILWNAKEAKTKAERQAWMDIHNVATKNLDTYPGGVEAWQRKISILTKKLEKFRQ